MRIIVKLHNYYFEYSTTADAPLIYGLNRDEFEIYYIEEYGENSIKEFQERMERVEAKGTSALFDKTAEETLSCNRAGPDETELTVDEIYRAYCLREKLNGWEPE